MVCPYAKNVRGMVAYCQLLGAKVSTLKYPCKGNYRRCPIYRARAARRPAAVARAEAGERAAEAPPPAQRREAAEAPAPSVAPTAPTQPPPQPVEAAAAAPAAGGEQEAAEAAEAAPQRRLGESVCDDTVAAELLLRSRFLGSVSIRTSELAEKAGVLSSEHGGVVFFTGSVDGGVVRGVAAGGVLASLYAELGGRSACGEEALELLGGEREARIRVYLVDMERLSPFVAEKLREDVGLQQR